MVYQHTITPFLIIENSLPAPHPRNASALADHTCSQPPLTHNSIPSLHPSNGPSDSETDVELNRLNERCIERERAPNPTLTIEHDDPKITEVERAMCCRIPNNLGRDSIDERHVSAARPKQWGSTKITASDVPNETPVCYDRPDTDRPTELNLIAWTEIMYANEMALVHE